VLFRSVAIIIYAALIVAAFLQSQVQAEAKQARDNIDRQMADRSARQSDTIMQYDSLKYRANIEVLAQRTMRYTYYTSIGRDVWKTFNSSPIVSNKERGR